MQQMSVGEIKSYLLMIKGVLSKMMIEGDEAFTESVSGVWSEEEDNETVKWRKGFKNFERCRKRKQQ